MSDFYCEQVLSGKTLVEKVFETANILAFYHTKPSYPVHIVVIPKHHIPSLLELTDQALCLEMMDVVRQVAEMVTHAHTACRVITNLGDYQESKHLHWHVISGKHFE
jgi:histidine triad (HIT) family protein